MSIEGQGHFLTIYFPGFVCFVLYLDKISGERLQDHWSSGYEDLTKIIFELSSNTHLISSADLGSEKTKVLISLHHLSFGFSDLVRHEAGCAVEPIIVAAILENRSATIPPMY